MCYLIAKKFNDIGCLAIQMTHGRHLAEFKEKLMQAVGTDTIQLVTISRPSAYGEYEPYHFADTEQEFEKKVIEMKQEEIDCFCFTETVFFSQIYAQMFGFIQMFYS